MLLDSSFVAVGPMQDKEQVLPLFACSRPLRMGTVLNQYYLLLGLVCPQGSCYYFYGRPCGVDERMAHVFLSIVTIPSARIAQYGFSILKH